MLCLVFLVPDHVDHCFGSLAGARQQQWAYVRGDSSFYDQEVRDRKRMG